MWSNVWRRFWLAAVALVATSLVETTPAVATAVVPECPATARHVTPAHRGSSCTVLPTAAPRRWSVRLNGPTSYPIIAAGKVFVTTAPGPSYGGWLYALDASTGAVVWGPVPLSGTYYYFPLAFGSGRLFVNNFDGKVVAFNPGTGRQLWASATGDHFSGEPVVYDGVVYVHGSAGVTALSATDGSVLWRSAYLDGDGSALAVDASGVYVNGGCSQFRLSHSGTVLWRHNDGCTGGGGGTSYLAGGRFFSETGNHVFNKLDGKVVSSYAGTPAFAEGAAYTAVGSSIFAEDLRTRRPLFTVDVPSRIVAGPIIANGVVYVGAEDAKVYGLSTTDGRLMTTKSLPGVPGGGGQYFGPPSDMGIGQGILVVPTGATVTAFG